MEAYRIEVEEGVAAHLIGPGAIRLTEIETLAKRRFFLEGKAGVPLDHFKVKKEGKLVDIAPESPVEEGAEIRLELVEVGEHDMTAGVGKLDGLAIVVADAAQMIGKKAKVRVERVLNGTGYATLVQPATKKVEAPITAEAEAEKPTRAPRKKKAEEPKIEKKPDTGKPETEKKPETERPKTEQGKADEPVAEEPEDAETAEDEAPKPKKKTRRGSRGGRNRRKKPATATAAQNGQADQAPASATIHVPSPELGQSTDGEGGADGDAPPKKKRTRRGSRGGRNRRKKSTTATTSATSEAKPEPSGD
jgi:predicted RNA-binding protein with TRAM domain